MLYKQNKEKEKLTKNTEAIFMRLIIPKLYACRAHQNPRKIKKNNIICVCLPNSLDLSS